MASGGFSAATASGGVASGGEAASELARWVSEGRILHQEDVQEGIENAPRTFQRLFRGENKGKQLLKLADPED